MKKLFCLILICALLPALPALAADKAVYTTNAKLSAPIYAEMSRASRNVGRVNEVSTIYVYQLYPDWAYISCNGNKGYVPRSYLQVGKAVDKQNTPPWGVEFYHYVGVAGENGVVIRTAPERDSDALIRLDAGTRISIIAVENGWARLGYYRQYGYIDTNTLKELLPVCTDAFSGTEDTPIATFTTYYVVGSDDVSVHGKEINIGVNCADMNGTVLAAGKTMDYDQYFGAYSPRKGYVKGPVLIETGWGLGYGGGVCQVSSTLYNLLLQLPGINIIQRRSHGSNGAEYLPLDMDAAVGNDDSGIDMVFRNEYDFALRFEARAQNGALFIALYRVTE